MRSVVVLLVCVGCSDVDIDLLAQTASPCDLGEVGGSVDVTPPVTATGGNPGRGWAVLGAPTTASAWKFLRDSHRDVLTR